MNGELRIDELARQAGVATTTVRLYQSKGLVPPPRLEGRTGWYGPHHLARLRLIGRLQDDGFSLAGIGRLLEQWEAGRSLDAVVGIEEQMRAILGTQRSVEMTPAELAEHMPVEALDPEAMQRAAGLGLVELTVDGSIRIPDRRFLETGAALAGMGVPVDSVLDEWEALTEHMDDIASRFTSVFEAHLLPSDWQEGLEKAETTELARNLARLRGLAHEVVDAALDAALARQMRERLAAVVESVEAVLSPQ